MHPELFRIGSLTIYSYGFMILVGVILAWLFMMRRMKRLGHHSETVSELFLWCFVGVFVGGKVFYYLEDPGKYVKDPGLMLQSPGNGFVFYGSFLFTVPILIWWFRKKNLPVWPMFDLVGIAGALVHGFGKIGCLMAGCCHGRVCDSGWCITFSDPLSHATPLDTPLYPTQIWDAGIIFLAVALMFLQEKRKKFHGQMFLIYGLVYAIGRFLTESYRGDEERGFVLGGLLSHSQAIALLVFSCCLVLYIYRYKRYPVQAS